jgi:hypothetical protein
LDPQIFTMRLPAHSVNVAPAPAVVPQAGGTERRPMTPGCNLHNDL